MSKQEKTESGAYYNLLKQIESIEKHNNMGSKKTKDRYGSAIRSFIRFAADRFNLQKFVNAGQKHMAAYAEEMKKYKSANTVMTDLSAIRFYYDHAKGENYLGANKSFELKKREPTAFDNSFLPEEITEAINTALDMKRDDAFWGVRITYRFGYRIEEACRMTYGDVLKALENGEIKVKGKGGLIRYVPVETVEQKALLNDLCVYAKKKGLKPSEMLITDNVTGGVEKKKASLENWMYNNRKKFTVTNRTEMVKPGKKPRTSKISWHGLRHTYAQETYARYIREGMSVEKALRKVSENLGHHRMSITDVYLDENVASKLKKKK